MSGASVTVARVYLSEAEHLTERVVEALRGEVRGVTLFRGISGFGRSGTMHSASLVDLSLNLPVVVEFFDDPERVTRALDSLRELVDPDHIVTWPARVESQD